MLTGAFDEDRLHPDAVEEADPAAMLRAVATSAAQVRLAVTAVRESGVLARLSSQGMPRAIVVTGMGAASLSGHALAALAGLQSPVPVVVHEGYGLPSWVGAADLVLVGSASGETEETLSGVDDARRRSAPVIAMTAEGSSLHRAVAAARGQTVPVPTGRPARTNLWSMAAPMLAIADAVGVLSAPPGLLELAAVRLEEVSLRCSPMAETFLNPAKGLASRIAGTIPVVWGGTPVMAVAARRFAAQLHENTRYPAMWGELPGLAHLQLAMVDGPWAGRAEDVFADPDELGPRLHLVVLRNGEDEHSHVARRMSTAVHLAQERGVLVSELAAEGASQLERLASLVGLLDYASVYLAIGLGVDPAALGAVDELRRLGPR